MESFVKGVIGKIAERSGKHWGGDDDAYDRNEHFKINPAAIYFVL